LISNPIFVPQSRDMPKTWFKDWFNSHYYHLLYQHRDDQEALDFIEKLVAHLQPAPGSKMLDVACGKGRHSKALAEMGFDVTGIDLSDESISEAKLNESDSLHFYQHDMRHISGSIILILPLIFYQFWLFQNPTGA